MGCCAIMGCEGGARAGTLEAGAGAAGRGGGAEERGGEAARPRRGMAKGRKEGGYKARDE